MLFDWLVTGQVIHSSPAHYYPQKKRWWLRLREKNGKVKEMPCHHKLESYLDAAVGEVCQLTTITCCKTGDHQAKR